MVTGATLTGRLVSRTGKVTIFPIVGLSVATVSLVVTGLTISFASTPWVLGLTALTGVALGMVMPAMQVAVQHAAGREALGAAIGSMSLSRSVGGAIGVAITGAIIFVSIGRVDPAMYTTLEHVMGAGPDYLRQLSVADRAAVSAELDHTFRLVFFGIAVITALGAMVAATVPKPEF
jgi:MFS family permease